MSEIVSGSICRVTKTADVPGGHKVASVKVLELHLDSALVVELAERGAARVWWEPVANLTVTP